MNILLHHLYNATSLHDLARAMNVPAAALAYTIYKIPDAARYKTFEIAKASGGTRTIHAPCKQLKSMQAALAELLTLHIEHHEKISDVKHPVSHGFRKSRSIFTNARAHRRKRYVFNIDLKDFFPSIHFGRIVGLLTKDKTLKLDLNVARMIANLAVHRHNDGTTFLPQGSPCSPALSNMIARPLDLRLRKLAKRRKCRYSRYADDLTFSTNKRDFPKGLAKIQYGSDSTWVPGKRLTTAIVTSGFTINSKKTRMQLRGSRQVVTGLVVNEKLSVDRTTYKSARAAAHKLFTTGTAKANNLSIRGQDGANGPISSSYLEGIFAHICNARREGLPLSENPWVLSKAELSILDQKKKGLVSKKDAPQPNEPSQFRGPEKVHRQLVLYRKFFERTEPLIIAEGKTDSTYLKLAISQRAARFPLLSSAPGVAFLRQSSNQVQYVIGLHEGAGNLGKLIGTYERDMKFTGERRAPFPVIFLLDNDSGADKALNQINALRKAGGAPPLLKSDIRKEDYIWICRNLYVILTPLIKGKQTTIEDFLDKNALKIELNGRRFSPKNGADNTKFYGKVELAQNVVFQNADKLSFKGFDVLLKHICDAINDYSTRK